MIIHNVAQNSAEWLQLRLGIPTASEFSRIVTPKTGQLSKSADAYLYRLLAEWVRGVPIDEDDYQSRWMIRGQELEDQAVSAYEFETDRETQLVGFVTDDHGRYGCSPDRFVMPDGILEIKCPSPGVHVGYLLTGKHEDDYWPQLQGQMFVCDREWVEICSYCPGFPAAIMRVNRDEKWTAILRSALNAFCDRLAEAKVLLGQRYGITGKVVDLKPPSGPGDGLTAFGVTQEDVDMMIAARKGKA